MLEKLAQSVIHRHQGDSSMKVRTELLFFVLIQLWELCNGNFDMDMLPPPNKLGGGGASAFFSGSSRYQWSILRNYDKSTFSKPNNDKRREISVENGKV